MGLLSMTRARHVESIAFQNEARQSSRRPREHTTAITEFDYNGNKDSAAVIAGHNLNKNKGYVVHGSCWAYSSWNALVTWHQSPYIKTSAQRAHHDHLGARLTHD